MRWDLYFLLSFISLLHIPIARWLRDPHHLADLFDTIRLLMVAFNHVPLRVFAPPMNLRTLSIPHRKYDKTHAKSRENCQTSENDAEMQRVQRPEFLFIRIAQQHANQESSQPHPRTSPGQTFPGHLCNGGTWYAETGNPGHRGQDVSGRREG